MDDNFSLRAALKSNGDLHNCIDNREKFLPETVEAAVKELQSRGAVFSGEELEVISEDMQARRSLAGRAFGGLGAFNSRDKNNLVDDPEAPSLFSRRVIYIFSVLFSVFFGSVMLAMNTYKTPNKSKAIWVVTFGLAFTIATVIVGDRFGLSSSFTVLASIVGAYLLEAIFWDRLIGKATLYRARAIWVPLIIGLAIVIPTVILIIYSGQG